MALVTWDPSFSVQVRRCDEDHKKLFAIINTLHDAMSVGKGGEVVQRVVEELLDYTKVHFSAEEALLERTKYPGLTGHRQRHKEFVTKVEEFQKDLAHGKAGQSIVVLTFLKDWLTNHIRQIDQQYSAHMKASGVS